MYWLTNYYVYGNSVIPDKLYYYEQKMCRYMKYDIIIFYMYSNALHRSNWIISNYSGELVLALA